MSSIRNWKGPAFGALAALHKLYEERATIDERITKAIAECERLGCTVERRWGEPEVSVDSARDAVACSCGAIIPLTYERRDAQKPLSCRSCFEEGARQVLEDQRLEKEPAP